MRKVIKTNRNVGEPSSEFGYDPTGEKFSKTVQRHMDEQEQLWQDFRAWMIEHHVNPEKLRYLFVKLHEEFLS